MEVCNDHLLRVIGKISIRSKTQIRGMGILQPATWLAGSREPTRICSIHISVQIKMRLQLDGFAAFVDEQLGWRIKQAVNFSSEVGRQGT